MRGPQRGVVAACLLQRAWAECATDLDCELSGECSDRVCHCDPEWTGEHCTSLSLTPIEVDHYAFHQRSPDDSGRWWNSWGSSQPIKDEHGKYHLLATRMLNGCAVVPDYTYNQDLVHAVSNTLLGPYTYQNVALSTTVINPTMLRAPDGNFVVFYSGEPLPPHFHKNCTSEGTLPDDQRELHRRRAHAQEPPGPPGYENIGCVLSIATSASMNKAFSVRAANFTPVGAEGLFCRTNPTAWIFPNGTTLLYFRSAQRDGHNEQIWVARAPHYLGQYTIYGDSPIFPVNNEDPFVFMNRRGHFVMMLHKSHWGPGMNGAKAFSYDGLTWHYTDESMSSVWSSTISYTDGSTTTFQRREEPKIYVEDGRLLAMFNAVADTRVSADTSYVMSQGINQAVPPYASFASGVCANTGGEIGVEDLLAGDPKHAWYTDDDLGVTGVCDIESVPDCHAICSRVRGCRYFATSTTKYCYACFVSRTCDAARPVDGYAVYEMSEAVSV